MDNVKTKNNTKLTNPKILKGTVVSDKMKDTATVLVIRFVKHQKYKKYYKINKKYKAHDVGNVKKVRDKVSIQECKPISKDKHFVILK